MWLGNRVRFSMLIIASRLICYIYLSSLILNFSLLMVAKTPESEAGFMWPPKPQYAASLFVLLSSVTTHTAIWSLTYHLHNLQSTKGKKICCQRWPYLWLQTSLVQTRLLWLQLNQCAGFMWPPKQPQYAASLSVPLSSVAPQTAVWSSTSPALPPSHEYKSANILKSVEEQPLDFSCLWKLV